MRTCTDPRNCRGSSFEEPRGRRHRGETKTTSVNAVERKRDEFPAPKLPTAGAGPGDHLGVRHVVTAPSKKHDP